MSRRATRSINPSDRFSRRCLSLLCLFASTMNANALSCQSPDEIMQKTLQTAGPPFPGANIVIYGAVVELLPDELAKSGLKTLTGDSSLARVRVIEGFRGAAEGQMLVLRTNNQVAGSSGFSVADRQQLMLVKNGVVQLCSKFWLPPEQLEKLRDHFKSYPNAKQGN